MSYLRFLAEWFNAPYVVAAVAAVMLWIGSAGRSGRRRIAFALLAAAVVGLTVNGAIHDLSLGSPGSRFWPVLLTAVAAGTFLSAGASAVSARLFPPVTGVTWNQPGLEGSAAQIVTAVAGSRSATGRARVRGEAGVIHVIRVHTEGRSLRFGRRVRVGAFDPERQSYEVEAV